jgi:hypothetical protein
VRSTSPAARLDPSPQGADPLSAVLRQLARRTDSPRVRQWADALVAAGESASGGGGRQEGVVRTVTT